MKYHICCATDENYAQHCAVMLCSLFENNKVESFVIHILTSNLDTIYFEKIESLVRRYNSTCFFYEADVAKLRGAQYRKKRPLTEAAYYRILLASTLDSSIERVLYLDCDLLVLGDITSLFKIELNNYPIAAVKEPVDILDDHRMQLSFSYGDEYFNSGVLLVNLNYWRNHNIEPKLIEFANRKRKVYCHDQDALNYVFKKQWFRLSPKWNKSNLATLDEIEFQNIVDEMEYIKKPIIVHFIDEPKPWQGVFLIKNRKKYCYYLTKSEWTYITKLQKIKREKKRELYLRTCVFFTKSFLYTIGLLRVFKRFKIISFGKVKHDT